MPGTPEGVGQQRCSLDREEDGRITATISEVIEFEPPHRLVVKTLTGPTEALAVMAVNPTLTGCTYTASGGTRIAYGTSRKIAPIAQRAIDELTAKVRSIVESGLRLETVNKNPETSGGGEGSDSVSPVGDHP